MSRGVFGLLLLPLVLVVSPAGPGAQPHPERSLVRIAASGCSAVDTLATGWVSRDGLVVTVAHAVRGSTAVRANGLPARVVAVDNRTDVSVLAPQVGVDAASLPIGSPRGEADVWLGRFAGPQGAGIATRTGAGAVVTTTIDEPIDGVTYSRQAFPVAIAIDHGDSGAPVVDNSGRAVGMTFATARDGSPVAYAVAAQDIRTTMQNLDTRSPSVDTGRCN